MHAIVIPAAAVAASIADHCPIGQWLYTHALV